MANKFIVCKSCLANNKYPQVLGVIYDFGILNIKRVNKLSTIIGGKEILVTCDQCNSTVVLQIKLKQPAPLKINGTISIEETQVKYNWS